MSGYHYRHAHAAATTCTGKSSKKGASGRALPPHVPHAAHARRGADEAPERRLPTEDLLPPEQKAANQSIIRRLYGIIMRQ